MLFRDLKEKYFSRNFSRTHDKITRLKQLFLSFTQNFELKWCENVYQWI